MITREQAPATDLRLDIRRANASIQAVRAGRPVIVTSSDRASLVMAASEATTSAMAFLVRRSSGFVAVALPEEVCDRLQLPPMWSSPRARRSTSGISIDLSAGSGTGISAADRGATARACADPDSTALHFTRPGHLLTVRVASASDQPPDVATIAMLLAHHATGFAAGLFADIPSEIHADAMASGDELTALADDFDMPILAIADAFTPAAPASHGRRLRTTYAPPTRSEARSTPV